VSQALERIRQGGLKSALALSTRGGSRVPELGTLGSVRGALSNERPYRDPLHQESCPIGPTAIVWREEWQKIVHQTPAQEDAADQ
jgi:hypothetical protein